MSSIACGVMPNREAESRSITSVSFRPPFCRSLATSRNSEKAFSLFHQPRRPDRQFVRVGILQAVLKLGARHAAFDGQVLHRLHVEA